MFPPEDRRSSTFLTEPPQKVGGHSPWFTTEPEATRFVRTTPEARAIVSEEPASHEDISVAALDRTEEGRTGPLSPAPMDQPPREGGEKRTPDDDRRSAELTLEAANPVPPHLRAAGPLIRGETRPGMRSARRPAVSRSVCASCSKVVVDLRMSGPCPKCLRPVCGDCLREALVTQGHGWCLDCAAAAAAAS